MTFRDRAMNYVLGFLLAAVVVMSIFTLLGPAASTALCLLGLAVVWVGVVLKS